MPEGSAAGQRRQRRDAHRKVDGFFGNDAIRILMPEKLKTVWPHADPKTGTYPISSGAERRSAIREMGYVPI